MDENGKKVPDKSGLNATGPEGRKGVDDERDAKKPSSSKQGVIIALAVLVVIIAVAAVAYNVLAPNVATQNLQAQDGAQTSEQAASDQSASSEDPADPTTSSSDSASQDSSTSDEEQELSDAPDINMTDIDGKTVKLSSFEGKPVVLNFWASTCGPCKSEMPEFQSAFEEYGDDVQFIMLNVPDFNGETRQKALQLIEDSDYTFPVYFDDGTQGQKSYGITSIPQTYFIDAQGKVAAYAAGAINETVLKQGLDYIL